MKTLKNCLWLVAMFAGLNRVDAAYYLIDTTIQRTTIYFDTSLTQSNMLFGWGTFPLMVTGDTNTPNITTNILSVTFWDGTNKVGFKRGPFPPLSPYFFERDLTNGSHGFDVLDFQTYMNNHTTNHLAETGVGSKTQETITFASKSLRAGTNFAISHGFDLTNGIPFPGLGPQSRAFLNGEGVMKDYILIDVPFTTISFVAKGNPKVIRVTIETTPEFTGKLQLGATDPTDWSWNFKYGLPQGTNTMDVLQNYNPTRGVDIQFPMGPQLFFENDNLIVLGKPGKATILHSLNLRDWLPTQPIVISSEGVGFTPITVSTDTQFFRATQP